MWLIVILLWMFSARERRENRAERHREVGEAQPLYDPYDDFDLQEELYGEEGLEDVLSFDPVTDTGDLMSYIVSPQTTSSWLHFWQYTSL